MGIAGDLDKRHNILARPTCRGIEDERDDFSKGKRCYFLRLVDFTPVGLSHTASLASCPA